MTDHALTFLADTQLAPVSMHDRVQIALAIADEDLLRSLLVTCTPPLAADHQIGSITSKIGVPVEQKRAVDGLITYEAIACVLVDSPEHLEQQISATTHPRLLHREYLNLTRCESDTQTLGHGLSLAQAIAILTHAGLSANQVDAILNVPTEAWHRSWWYSLDPDGDFTQPFLRLMRTLRYTDGTFTLQYKDYFAQNRPPCFTSQAQRVLVEIRSEQHSFRKTLERINASREALGVQKALLICNTLSELEARGFISQGISVYAANPIALSTQANCTFCTTERCPMRGQADSPVLTCRNFCLDAST